MAGKIISLKNVTKRFGSVVAVNGISMDFRAGECVSLVGHNGAGKSTLIHLITGALTPTGGTVHDKADREMTGRFKRAAGVRCVQQELSLCPNLTVAENMRILYPELKGYGWRKQAAKAIKDSLDTVFPGHGINPTDLVESLPISRRQQVEIARAFAVLDDAPDLVILDEPTSALDRTASEHLFEYVKKFVAKQGSVILVTHKMNEVFEASHRVMVMRDGQRVAEGATSDFTFDSLIKAMGHAAYTQKDPNRKAKAFDASSIRIEARDPDGNPLVVHKGEIVGLAGLAGHGQSEMVRQMFAESGGGQAKAGESPLVALVAGDRQRDGLLQVWNILQNISVASLGRLTRHGRLDLTGEHALANRWSDILQIKCESVEDPIMSLSGGGQQKVLFARALASDADFIVMDDPMRGVDFGTKQEVYKLIREEAEKGRSFLWYTTEFDELLECDRTYVLRQHCVAAEMSGNDITEENVLAASFER